MTIFVNFMGARKRCVMYLLGALFYICNQSYISNLLSFHLMMFCLLSWRWLDRRYAQISYYDCRFDYFWICLNCLRPWYLTQTNLDSLFLLNWCFHCSFFSKFFSDIHIIVPDFFYVVFVLYIFSLHFWCCYILNVCLINI